MHVHARMCGLYPWTVPYMMGQTRPGYFLLPANFGTEWTSNSRHHLAQNSFFSCPTEFSLCLMEYRWRRTVLSHLPFPSLKSYSARAKSPALGRRFSYFASAPSSFCLPLPSPRYTFNVFSRTECVVGCVLSNICSRDPQISSPQSSPTILTYHGIRTWLAKRHPVRLVV